MTFNEWFEEYQEDAQRYYRQGKAAAIRGEDPFPPGLEELEPVTPRELEAYDQGYEDGLKEVYDRSKWSVRE